MAATKNQDQKIHGSMKEHYQKVVVPHLLSTLPGKKGKGKINPMAVPAISHIVVNIGVGEAATAGKGEIENALNMLTQVTGQKAVVTKVRRSEAAFKIREGWPIGVKVTLRGEAMYHFLHRLVAIVFPRMRDFKGLTRRSFDGRGNFNCGISGKFSFPEIPFDFPGSYGADIAIVTTASDDDGAYELLKSMRMPFIEAVAERRG